MQWFLLLSSVFLSQMTLVLSRPKSWREGPIVDPGVFVITQIKECRNRMGYCILGRSCQVDTDFVPDDLGGNCDRLSEAFNPKATFVCCKQNPALFEEDDEFEAIIQEVNISHPTAAVSVAEGEVHQDENKDEEISSETGVENKPDSTDDKSPAATVTELITELYTETDTTVEDITKVVEDFIVA